MPITFEYLASLRDSLDRQRLEAVARVNQLLGGITAIDLIVKRLAAEEPVSEDDLKAALGADEVSVEPVSPSASPS